MPTFIKVKLKKSYDQKNIKKYRAAANITKYRIISKINLPKNRHSKIHDDNTIIYVKNVCNNVNMFKLDASTFWL